MKRALLESRGFRCYRLKINWFCLPVKTSEIRSDLQSIVRVKFLRLHACSHRPHQSAVMAKDAKMIRSADKCMLIIEIDTVESIMRHGIKLVDRLTGEDVPNSSSRCTCDKEVWVCESVAHSHIRNTQQRPGLEVTVFSFGWIPFLGAKGKFHLLLIRNPYAWSRIELIVHRFTPNFYLVHCSFEDEEPVAIFQIAVMKVLLK